MSLFNHEDITDERMTELQNMTMTQLVQEKEFFISDDDITKIVFHKRKPDSRLFDISEKLRQLDKVSLARYLAIKSGIIIHNEDTADIDNLTGSIWEKCLEEVKHINQKL